MAGNLLKTYLKIRIHILGSGKLERAFRAFICATGDLCRPLSKSRTPRSPMLEPREVIQTQLEIWGSENNTHLSLPYLGWVGICGSPEKQAISCGYAGRRGSETAWAGHETNSGPPCSTLLLQGTPCTFGVNRLQTIALETREDVRNSSQMLRKLTEMAGREREELHHERAFALEHHRSSKQGVWAASPIV